MFNSLLFNAKLNIICPSLEIKKICYLQKETLHIY